MMNGMKIIHFPLYIAIVMSGSCHDGQAPLSTSERNILKDSIHIVLENYYSDIRKHGLMAEFSYLDTSSDFFWVPPGFTQSISYDSVSALLKKNAPLFSSVVNTWAKLDIQPLRRDFVVYTGRLHSFMVDTTGKETSFNLVETGLLVRRKDGWKLLCGQTGTGD